MLWKRAAAHRTRKPVNNNNQTKRKKLKNKNGGVERRFRKKISKTKNDNSPQGDPATDGITTTATWATAAGKERLAPTQVGGRG